MTWDEIVSAITSHRANAIDPGNFSNADFVRKIEETEWALQAIAEKLRDKFPGE